MSTNLTFSIKVVRIRLPDTAVLWFVWCRTNCHDPAGTEHDAFLLNQLYFQTKMSTKDLYSIVENWQVCTNRSALHTNVDWRGSRVWFGSVLTRVWSRDNHSHTISISHVFCSHRITHDTLQIHECMVLEGQGLKFYECLNLFQSWRPQPPPPPLFDDDDNGDDDDDDWLSWRKHTFILDFRFTVIDMKP
jgi:hypothetical protein